MSAKITAEFVGLEKSAERAAKRAGRNLKINIGSSARSVDSLSQPLGRITGKADEFTKSMEAANARVLAFGASVGVLRAVTQSFKDIVVTTIQVEKQMASINAILGASTGELSKFKKEIFDVARNTEQSFDTVATAALELSRQGLKAEEVVKRLNDSLILSRLSGQSAADAVAGLTSAINGFKKAGITSAEVVNKFSEAAKSAAVSERDLAEAFKRAGAVAGQAGVSFDELVGIVSAVQEKTSRGGAVIGNSFKTIFTRIQSLDKLKTMQELGVQVTDASGGILSATELIKNLASSLENFPDARRLQIAEGLVGKFQVAPFISILEDYNDETSKAIKITEISAKATTAAYERNDALNKTLSASINQVTVNLSELAEMLGKIGVTDSLQNVLGFFNNMVEGLKGLLDEETGSSIAKGLVKGIGNVISGPGLAIFAAVIGKLTLDLVKFGTGSLKTFFGMNRAAKEQATLQGQIASTLLSNKGIQDAILKIERSSLSAEEKKAQQTKFFTTALNEQLSIMQRMQSIAARVAPGVRAGTRGRGAFGRGAGGYVPNFAGGSVVGSEQADINRGVGGAPPSARPVSIPNFNFGGGQRGTMVANTSEFIVPNFGGGSAIFNQNMAASMGLPAGARRVGAAGGYIPNFAGKIKSEEGHFHTLSRQTKTKVDEAANYKGGDQNLLNKRDAAIRLQNQKGTHFDATSKKFVMVVPQVQGPTSKTVNFQKLRGDVGSFTGQIFGISPGLKDNKKFRGFLKLEENIKEGLAGAANKVAGNLADDIMIKPRPVTKNNITDLIRDEGGAGALGAIQGAFFESIVNAVRDVGAVSKNDRGTLDFILGPTANNRKFLETVFGLPSNAFNVGDYKSSSKSFPTFADQVLKNVAKNPKLGTKNFGKSKKASGGYIPNFVGDLENAIGREAAAGVPINQIRVNQKGTLRNSANPMGLAVTNTRDEPTGAIPNFFTQNIGQELNTSANMRMAKETERVAKESKNQANTSKQVARANRDMLGTIFAVQMGLSLLSGATSDAEKGFGRFSNRLVSSLSTVTTAALAGSAITQLGDSFKDTKPGLAKFAKGIGTASVVIGGVVAAVSFFKNIMNDASGETDAAARNVALLADAADTAGAALNRLGEVGKLMAKDEAEAILAESGLGFKNKKEQEPAMITAISRAVAGGVGRKGILDIIGRGREGFARTKRSSLELTSMIEELGDKTTLSGKSVDRLFENLFASPKALKQIRSSLLKTQIQGLRDTKDADNPLKLIGEGFTTSRSLTGNQRFDDEVATMFTRKGVVNPVGDLQLKLLEKFGREQSDFVFNLIRRRVTNFREGGGLAGATEAGNRVAVDEAKQLIQAQLNQRLLGAAGSTPEKVQAAMAGRGMLRRDASTGARIGLATSERELKAFQNFNKIILESIDVTKDLNVESEGFKNAMEFLDKVTFEDIKDFGALQTRKDVSVRGTSGKSPIEIVQGFGALGTMEKFLSLLKATTPTGPQLEGLARKFKAEDDLLKIDLKRTTAAENLKRALDRIDAERRADIVSNAAEATIESGNLQFQAATAAGAFDRLRAGSNLRFAEDQFDAGKNLEMHLLANQAKQLRDTLISASEQFATNISDGLVDAIVQGKSLKETLVSAATNFFTMMSKAYMKQAVDNIVGGGGLGGIFGLFQRNASGGMISGGSGVKDDVPALLTGGEFVMRKSSVQKYGSNFMNSLNQGSVPKFSNGGMFIPGTYGQGAISGKDNLLNFATQTGTSGAFDRFGGGAGFASIALAPESLSLTNLGRSLSPAFKRTQAAKGDAFDLFVQQLNADKQRKEQERELAQAKKDRRRGLFASLGLAAGLSFLGGSDLFGGGKAPRATPVDLNIAPKALPVDAPFYKPSLLPSLNLFGGRKSSGGKIDTTIRNMFEGPQLSGPDNSLFPKRPMGGMIPYMAGGGGVPYAAGVDTVPAMLSGGEFVMNAGATQRIGAGNLETLNAGGGIGGGSSTNITKGDTNISIVVNSDGGEKENNSGSANQEDQNLAVKLKDAVRDVLSQEKRLGGMLRV